MALREILAKFGFDYDKAQLSSINKDVDSTKSAITGVLATLAGVAFVQGVRRFVNGIADAAAGLGKLALQTGESVDRVEFLLFAMPVPAEEAEQALRKLTIAMGHGEAGAQGQSAAFAKLGVSLTDASGNARPVGDVLENIVANFGNLKSPGEKAATAVELFGREGVKMIPFLEKGKDGLAALKQEFEELGGGFGQEAVENALKYKKAIKNLNLALDSLEGALVGPIFEPLAQLIGWFAKGIGFLKNFTKNTEIAKSALIVLGIAGSLAIGSLLAPFAPVIAAVTTLSLLLDDLVNFVQGNDSVIGAALNGLFGEGTAAKVSGMLQDVNKEVKGFFEDLLQHPKKFKEDLEKLFSDFTDGTFWSKILGFDIKKFLPKSGTGPFDSLNLSQQGPDTQGFKDLWATFAGGGDTGRQQSGTAVPKSNDALSTLADTIFGPLIGTQQTVGAAQPDVEPAKDWFGRLADNIFGASGSVPTTGTVPAGGPAPTINKVDQTNHVSITVQGDTPQEIKDAVDQGATKALANERRAAVAALEQRGGQ